MELKKITEIANHAYISGDIPDDMLKSIFIAELKKSGKIECKSHRTIRLMISIAKVILRIELDRMKVPKRKNLSDEQFSEA